MPKSKQFDKNKVLAAASAVFQQKGYNGTSIDEILKVTGLSRSSLYDSFTDKHTLYLEALNHYNNGKRQQFEGLNGKKMNGIEKIGYVFEEVVNHLTENPEDNGCLAVNAAAEMASRCNKTMEVVCNNKEDVKTLFTRWLEEAHKTSVVTLKKPAGSYGAFLFGALCGLKVLSQSGASKTELNNVVKVTLAAIA